MDAGCPHPLCSEQDRITITRHPVRLRILLPFPLKMCQQERYSRMISYLSIGIAALSLIWAITWSVWHYRRVHYPRILVNVQPAVFTAGSNMRFVPVHG